MTAMTARIERVAGLYRFSRNSGSVEILDLK
jgi:hypothetical protein